MDELRDVSPPLDKLEAAIERAKSLIGRLRTTNAQLTTELKALREKTEAGGRSGGSSEGAVAPPDGPELAQLRREREEIRTRIVRLLEQIED